MKGKKFFVGNILLCFKIAGRAFDLYPVNQPGHKLDLAAAQANAGQYNLLYAQEVLSMFIVGCYLKMVNNSRRHISRIEKRFVKSPF